MPAGLEVYDRFGNLKVGLGDRLMRFLDYVIVGVGDGSIQHDGLLTGVPFYVASMLSSDSTSFYPGGALYPPSVWFAGDQMFWHLNAGMPTQLIQFGVY